MLPTRSGDSRSSIDSNDIPMPGAFPDPGSPRNATSQQSLFHAVHARRAEYTKPRHIRLKIGTWNVASLRGTELDIGAWFVEGKGIEEKFAGLGVSPDLGHEGDARESVESQERRQTSKSSTIPKNDVEQQPHDDQVGIYVLGLQEIVDVGSATEAFKPYTDPTAANRYKTAVEEHMPPGYTFIAERQLIGMLLLIYAAPDVAPEIKSVSTTSVGTGLMGYMGNKGAVTARIVLGETTRLVFINSHLAAGAGKAELERRNWDAAQIVSRTRFDPIEDAFGISHNTGEKIGEEDFAFWFGDLNYRIDVPGDDIRRLLTLHTRNEYDLDQAGGVKVAEELEKLEQRRRQDLGATSIDDLARTIEDTQYEDNSRLPPEEDPASLQTTLLSLLAHDELHQQMTTRKAFHDGWKEAPIRFLPTYKYDVGSVGVFDSSDKRRGPSWCDRILYRARSDMLRYRQKVHDEEQARKKDEEMKAKGIVDAAEEDSVLFDYHPEDDGGDDYDETADPEVAHVETKDGEVAEILQEYYNAHQRVLSSDHKPLDAIFSLTYDAVDVKLKAKVHAEVAKDLDRAENEGRPTVTVIADRYHDTDNDETQPDTSHVNNEGISFGRIRMGQHKSRNVTIANTGQVAAKICFVNRPVAGTAEQESPTPSWMSIEWDRKPDIQSIKPSILKSKKASLEPDMYTLDPGEACNVNLVITIDGLAMVDELNQGTMKLEDVLILRVQDGRDHFLPVSATWAKSGLDKAVNKLTAIAGLGESAIRKIQRQSPDAST